jgi:hypothetical protein
VSHAGFSKGKPRRQALRAFDDRKYFEPLPGDDYQIGKPGATISRPMFEPLFSAHTNFFHLAYSRQA